MTKREFFNQVIAMTENEEMIAMAKHEIELLDKKVARATEKKSTANTEITTAVINALSLKDNAVTSTELVKTSAELEAYSVQRVTAILTKLVENGKVEKTTEKRKSYYRMAVDTAAEESEE